MYPYYLNLIDQEPCIVLIHLYAPISYDLVAFLSILVKICYLVFVVYSVLPKGQKLTPKYYRKLFISLLE